MESLTAQELKELRKIHGDISSEEGSDAESRLTFEDICKIYKPPPIIIDPNIHTIIEIGKCSNVTDTEILNSIQKAEVAQASTHTQNSQLTKSQKKRRRRKIAKQAKEEERNISNQEDDAKMSRDQEANSESEKCEYQNTNIKILQVINLQFGDVDKSLLLDTADQNVDHLHTKNMQDAYEADDDLNFKTQVPEDIKEAIHVEQNSKKALETKKATKREDEDDLLENEIIGGARKKVKRKRRKKRAKETNEEEHLQQNTETNNEEEENAKKKPRDNKTNFSSLDERRQRDLELAKIRTLILEIYDFFYDAPTDSTGICALIDLNLRELKTMNFREHKCITTIVEIMKNIATAYENYLINLDRRLRHDQTKLFTRFFYYVGTIVIESVMHGDEEIEFLDELNALENFVFVWFKKSLYDYMDIIVQDINFLTGDRYSNPFYKVVGRESSNNKMEEYVELAKVLKKQRMKGDPREKRETSLQSSKDTSVESEKRTPVQPTKNTSLKSGKRARKRRNNCSLLVRKDLPQQPSMQDNKDPLVKRSKDTSTKDSYRYSSNTDKDPYIQSFCVSSADDDAYKLYKSRKRIHSGLLTIKKTVERRKNRKSKKIKNTKNRLKWIAQTFDLLKILAESKNFCEKATPTKKVQSYVVVDNDNDKSSNLCDTENVESSDVDNDKKIKSVELPLLSIRQACDINNIQIKHVIFFLVMWHFADFVVLVGVLVYLSSYFVITFK